MNRRLNGEEGAISELLRDENNKPFVVEIDPTLGEAWMKFSSKPTDRLEPEEFGRVIGTRGNERVLIWFRQIEPSVDLSDLQLDPQTIVQTRKVFERNGFIVSPKRPPAHSKP